MTSRRPRILVIDNYDSFTHNLVHAASTAGASVEVARNDAVTLGGINASGFDGIILSPGPGHPEVPRDFGVCADLVRAGTSVPILGVCLGMQGLAHHTGGKVIAAPRPVHGEATQVTLDAHPLFAGLPPTIAAGRYHSLVVDADALPPDWKVIARGEGIVMAMAHRRLPWAGVQFHPESILTPHGPRILQNFLEGCA